MHPWIRSMTAAALLAAPLQLSAEELSRSVSVQGMVQTSSGVPANGTYDMAFGLYAAQSGGAPLWSGQQAGVAVQGGVFDAELGPIPTGPLETSAMLWLQTTVEGTALPRQPLRATPYALVAQTANTLQCSGCVTSALLGGGAVTPAKVASGTYDIAISGNAATATTAASATTLLGPLGGDVTGAQDATQVARIRGYPVATTVPSDGQVLKFDSVAGQWQPGTDAIGGAGTVTSVGTGTGLLGGPITGSGTITLRLSGAGGLSSTLNGNELGISSGGIVPAMVSSGLYGINISGNAATASSAASATTATSFTGSLAGDVTGTMAGTVVGRIRGFTVSTATPSNGHVLKFNSGTSTWEPSADLQGSGVTSVTASSPLASSGGTTPNITLGVVPAASGGTGLSQTPTAAGQLLRSSGSGQWAISGLLAADLPAGSTSYIHNGTAAQSANFRVTGSGQASTMYVTNWFRAYGTTGVHFEDYGGGLHMTDTTWVRVYGGKSLYVGSGTIRSDVDVRAPIFYDQNNTAYYVDPASTSNMNALALAGAATATGIITSNASVRAPIFYDTNNTGYYVDPASTTNLNALNVGGKALATYIRDYVNANCYVYFGWRDSCNGCTTAPIKYGRARGLTSGCGTVGTDSSCTVHTLFSQSVQMHGLSTDGDVDGNDKFWIGFKCE